MSTWAKIDLTIHELRAQLGSIQATTSKLDAALAERVAEHAERAERTDKARKYTSANGAVELNLDTGEFKQAGLALGSLPSEPQMITVTAGEWPESELPRNAIERAAFLGDQLMRIPAEHRESAELSTEDISFDRDGSDIRTALTYQRRETDRRGCRTVCPPERL